MDEKIREINFKFYKKSLYTILFFLFLTPSIRIVNGLPAIRLEELFILIILLILFFRLLKGKTVIFYFGIRQILLLGFMFIIVFSIFIGTIKGFNNSVFELNEVIKILKTFIISIIALTVFGLSNNKNYEINKLLDYILVLSVLLSILVIQQYYNIFGLNSYYIQHVAPTQYRTLMGNYSTPRPVGMTGNPNVLGFIFTLTSLISTFCIFARKEKVKYILIFFVNLLVLFITLSRSSLVAFIGGFLIIIFIAAIVKGLFKLDIKRISSMVLLILFIVASTNLLLKNTNFEENILWRFESLLTIEEDNSWNARVSNWNETIDLIKENPIMGVGTMSRSSASTVVDNEWLLLLRSFGLLGVIYYVLLYLIPYIKSKKSEYKVIELSILVAMFIYMIPASAYNSLIILPFIFIILSINDSKSKLIKITRW